MTGRFTLINGRFGWQVFSIFLVLSLALNAVAQDSPVVIATVGNSADVPAGKAVIREAYSRIGVEVEFSSYSAAEAIATSNSGVVSAELQRISGISQDYENLVQIPIPINIIQGAAFSIKYRFPISGWHSLRPYRIGIVRGIVFAERPTSGMNVSVANGYEELILMLENDEVDVGVMPRIQGLAAIHSAGNTEIVEMDGILETLFLYHYVHNSRLDLVESLTPVLKQMLLKGDTKRIREHVIAAMKTTE
jgi:polar amino acid transport system substrate-binding protein